jgi:hypothetical protein
MRYLYIFLLFIILLTGCVKYRQEPDAPYTPPPTPPSNEIGLGSLIINEFINKGNVDPNEFGVSTKWFEVYNAGEFAIALDTNFYLTDTLGTPDKFQVKITKSPIVIQPQNYVVVWCDNMDTAANANDIHTNFSLSSSGEAIGIFYQNPQGDLMVIDTLTFGPSTNSGVSIGRFPDGKGPHRFRGKRTPGKPNIE